MPASLATFTLPFRPRLLDLLESLSRHTTAKSRIPDSSC